MDQRLSGKYVGGPYIFHNVFQHLSQKHNRFIPYISIASARFELPGVGRYVGPQQRVRSDADLAQARALRLGKRSDELGPSRLRR